MGHVRQLGRENGTVNMAGRLGGICFQFIGGEGSNQHGRVVGIVFIN
jgi:hypothetical protein